MAVEKWYVEFSDEGFEESVVRRAVALELREVEIPGDPRRPGDSSDDVSLRILLARDDSSFMVSLWDRGEYAGRRRISASSHPRVMARRVGLAVGELGRQLSARRSRLVQRMERESFLASERKKEQEQARRLRDLGLRTDVQALVVPQGAYLTGPAIGVELNDKFPIRFSLGLSWMAGAIPALAESTIDQQSPTWSVFDLGLYADYVHPVSERSWISGGVMVAGSAVHVGGAAEVDEISHQRDTYTIRSGARFGYSYALLSDVRFRGELTAGSLLRSIPIRYGTTRLDLGGAFVGLNLGVTLAPHSKGE